VSQEASAPQPKTSTTRRLGRLASVIAAILIVASISYTLGNFNARDTISRPDMSWALGSAAAIKISDLSISLEHAANAIRERNPEASEADLGKAYDYLSGLLAASVEMHIAKGDPLQPAFTNWMSDYRKFLGDSPDAIYSTAPIDADSKYEVAITTGSADYLGFVVYERNPITGWNRVADSTSIVPDAENSVFRIRLTHESSDEIPESKTLDTPLEKSTGSTEGAEGAVGIKDEKSTPSIDSHDGISEAQMQGAEPGSEQLTLQLSDSSHLIMVREYFFDSGPRQPSMLTIERLKTTARAITGVITQTGTSGQSATPFKTRAANAVNFLNQTWQGSLALADALKETTNSFDRPATVSPDFVGIFYPTPDNDYHGGSFSLEPGEALVVEGEVPSAAFWSITLQDHWMQSIESNGQSASLRGSEITNREGRYRVWISDTPPPEGEDWLDTGDESEGLVAIRYLLADKATAPTANLKTLKSRSNDEARTASGL
jgi:hypothetical protein